MFTMFDSKESFGTTLKIKNLNERLDNTNLEINQINKKINSINRILKNALCIDNAEKAGNFKNSNPELYDLILEIISLLN